MELGVSGIVETFLMCCIISRGLGDQFLDARIRRSPSSNDKWIRGTRHPTNNVMKLQ